MESNKSLQPINQIDLHLPPTFDQAETTAEGPFAKRVTDGLVAQIEAQG